MPLRRLIVLYEPEASCRARLIEAGRPAEVATEIAFYLGLGITAAWLRASLP